MFGEGIVEQALLRLGIDATPRGDELNGQCPMHFTRTGKEDINPSWSINGSTGAHNCFSCGYKGSLLSLIAEVNEFTTPFGLLDFDEAKSWLAASTTVDLEALAKHLEEMKSSYISLPKPVQMSEARLAVFTDPPEWALEARGLTAEACKKYGVLWNDARSEWITTIRDAESGKLLGWQEKGQVQKTFFNRPAGIAKSKTLFGLNAYEGDTMIIVESPLDAVRLESVGISGGVAIFGAVFSDAQIDLMRRANKLIVAFDNPKLDAAGEKASKSILSSLKKAGMECRFFAYGDSGKKDIGDMAVEEINFGITNAKHCVFGEGSIYA